MGAVEPFTTMYTHVKEIIEEKNEADTFVAISIVRYVENLSVVLLVNPSSPSHQINHQSCRSDVPPEQECCVPQRQPSSSKVVHNHSPACVCFMLTDFCSSIHLPRLPQYTFQDRSIVRFSIALAFHTDVYCDLRTNGVVDQNIATARYLRALYVWCKLSCRMIGLNAFSFENQTKLYKVMCWKHSHFYFRLVFTLYNFMRATIFILYKRATYFTLNEIID